MKDIVRPVKTKDGWFFDPAGYVPGQENSVVRQFENTSDFWKYLDQHNPQAQHHHDKSISAMLKLGKYGWKEGLEHIKPYAAKMGRIIGNAIKQPVPAYDVVGEVPDVAMFLQGEPEHMVRFDEGDSPKRIVRLVVNTTYSTGLHDRNLRKGAVACALADAIERHGWSCEIVAASAVSCNNRLHWELHMPIKRADEALNMERVVFPLCHGSWDHVLIFRAQEQERGAIAKDCVSPGGCYYGPAEVEVGDTGDIYFGSTHQDNFKNDETATAFAMRELKKLGIELEETSHG